ncbi:MAG: VWA domain-containing protein [Verrucomicrobiota bacterium]
MKTSEQAVVFVMDHSQSLGKRGLAKVYERTLALRGELPGDVAVEFVAAGDRGVLLSDPFPANEDEGAMVREELMNEIGAQSNLGASVAYAQGLFPAGTTRHIVLVSDGLETRGDLAKTARESAVTGIRIHGVPVGGDRRPDVRVARFERSQGRLSEGASLRLTAGIESSMTGEGVVRLFENGLEVDKQDLAIEEGEDVEVVFVRTPEERNIYDYRVTVSGFDGDAIPENNEALTIVDVRGKPLLMYIEGEEGEGEFLVDAMAREGIRLEARGLDGIPRSLPEMAGYDGIILSDVAAHQAGEEFMSSVREYVDKLGGGFVMIGGMNSFGVGGYHRTPIEEILPVQLKAPDHEEQQSSALALVIDRSGSMSGQKIEICKSAAIATSEILTRKDYIGVYAFDSEAHIVAPMTRLTSGSSVAGQIAMLSSGGGTNIYPGMVLARQELGRVRAKIKHMIVLTDGQTSGQGYQALAAQCRSEGITISTVAVGSGAQVGLLQTIATAGGGEAYVTMDPTAITRIFTQDTLVHTGRMIREEAFQPSLAENHPMLANWVEGEAPPLLGYVKTNRKATAQVPLVTDHGEPLLAHWRFGLGKVTAFTSDCKSRWAPLWVGRWDGYSRIWAQILRETARPPQGQHMDIRLEEAGEVVRCFVDLLEDAGTRRNNAEVEMDVFFVTTDAMGGRMQSMETRPLFQEGPGMYAGSFRPEQPGVYLVRARSGTGMISAGHVHQPSAEVATGRVNGDVLRRAAEVTEGGYLDGEEGRLELGGMKTERYVALWPYLLMVLIPLILVDVMVRRWEHVRGVLEQMHGLVAPRA